MLSRNEIENSKNRNNNYNIFCYSITGTFMLNKGVDEVLFKDGVAWGIKTGNEVRTCTSMYIRVCMCTYSSKAMVKYI